MKRKGTNVIFLTKCETHPRERGCSSGKFTFATTFELKIGQLIVNATGIVIYRRSSYYLDRPLPKEPQPAAGPCIFNQTAGVEGWLRRNEFFANVDHEKVAQRLSFFFLSFHFFFLLCENNASLREFTNFLSCFFLSGRDVGVGTVARVE